MTVVLMGVAGAGKTTVMAALAARLGWPAAEGDEFHSPANVAKMRAGAPLTDEDRRPWLEAVAAWIGEREADGECALVSCSALKRSYRDLIRDGHDSVLFVHLVAPEAVLAARMEERRGHYMPASLLASQLGDLEPLASDEPGVVVPAEESPRRVAEDLLRRLPVPPRPRAGA
jgi:gluconokinase